LKKKKKKHNQKKGAWVEFVPEVLWSYHTTIRTPTGETPFSLTFGTEAVITAEVGSSSFRVSHYNLGLNDEGISLHLDLLQEKREEAQATYQQQATHYFNKKVNPRNVKIRDWVIRKMSLATKDPVERKFAPK
jgi:hypothetical protein